eukprot:g2757.t1
MALIGATGYFYIANRDLIELPKLPIWETKQTPVHSPVNHASATTTEAPVEISTKINQKEHEPESKTEPKTVPEQKTGSKTEPRTEPKIEPRTERQEPETSVKEQEPIPMEIIDSSPIVELFSEALGQRENSTGDTGAIDELTGKDVNVDILGGKLLALAVKEAVEGQPNWTEFKAQRKQALHDAEIIKHFFEKENDVHKEKVDGLTKELEDSQSKVESLEKLVQELKTNVDSKVQTELDILEKKHKVLMKKLEHKMNLEAAEKSLKERAERIKQLDSIRERVNSLALGLSYWMNQSEALTQTQRKVLETATIESVLNRDKSGAQNVPDLASMAMKDPFLQTVIGCIPEGPIPSKQELMRDLGKLRMTIEPMALLPTSGGGLLSQLVATIGTKLKIKVRDLENGADDLSARFDQIESSLADGFISEAIGQLTAVMENSGGRSLADVWIKDAQKYATLQQIHKLLLARGQELTMSISSL